MPANVIELKGEYATAKVFTDVVDTQSLSQVTSLLNQPYAEGSRIRMMPDIHAGVGCTIGTTMTIKDKVCPNMVGVDIGCGMETIQIRETHMEFQKLDKLIHQEIPSGFNIRNKRHRFCDQLNLENLRCAKHIDMDRALLSVGTLGGGNHFIEVDRDDNGNLYVVIHSGSRHLGVEIAKYYQDAGYKALTTYSKQEIKYVIQKLKDEGRTSEIQSTITNMNMNKPNRVPYTLAYVEGELMSDYIHDMKIAQEFAELNRRAMMDTIVKGMKFHIEDQFTTTHNYIDVGSMILRKGAVCAELGEKLLIPINMRDGSLICKGKGNEDWNYSAPHGAGRLMSRTEAREQFTVSEFRKQMDGIYTTSVNSNTLDECPMAYKDMRDIVNNIEPTATIISVIKPVYNFKAG